jgi:hypothetical protein
VDNFVIWLKGTALSAAITSHIWVWPLAETLHFVGLALVIGIAGFFDLRLMGFMNRVPVSAARDLMPFAVLGFGINLVTGMVFLIGQPDQYAHNPAWWLKVGFLALAGLNALAFETIVGPQTANCAAGDDTPLPAKIVGALSLLSWLGVLYWGRMLPYVGNAF